MKRFVLLFMVILFITFFIFFAYSFFFLGLREYIQVSSSISKLTDERQKQTAVSQFYPSNDQNSYSGIFAGVWNGKLWIWSKYFLRGYKIDEYTAFSFYDACSEFSTKESGSKFSVGRTIDDNTEAWLKKAKVGNYVNLRLATKEHGGTLGNLREIYGYNWLVFMPVDLAKECEK